MGETITLEVFKDQDFYVPAFSILVEGKERRQEMNDVMSISYSDSLTNVDSFDMTINNWDAETLAFKYSDSDIFNPWKDAEVWMGYYRNGKDQRRRMLIGEITTLSPNFPASGAPTLTVRGLNLFHRFRTKQENKPFFKQKETEIAEFLVKLINDEIKKKAPGLKLKLDEKQAAQNKKREDGHEIPFLLMNNQYPIVFLMERARRIGYDLSIQEIPREEVPKGTPREVIFRFGPTSDVERPTYILEWGKSLISFQPTLRTADQVNKVTVRGWDPRRKKPIEKTATRADLKGEKVVDPNQLGVIEPPLAQEITVDRPIANEVEATDFAKKILRQKAAELVTAKGKTVGLPDLRAGVKVQIKGLGRFSESKKEGKPFVYLVTETTHTISDSGYTTDFSARMEGSIDQP